MDSMIAVVSGTIEESQRYIESAGGPRHRYIAVSKPSDLPDSEIVESVVQVGFSWGPSTMDAYRKAMKQTFFGKMIEEKKLFTQEFLDALSAFRAATARLNESKNIENVTAFVTSLLGLFRASKISQATFGAAPLLAEQPPGEAILDSCDYLSAAASGGSEEQAKTELGNIIDLVGKKLVEIC